MSAGATGDNSNPVNNYIDKLTRSRPKVLYKKDVRVTVLRNLLENTFFGLSFLIKLQVFKKETPTQMFSCEFSES